MARDGCIYGIPNNTKRVLRVDPATDSAELIGRCWAGEPAARPSKWPRLRQENLARGLVEWVCTGCKKHFEV